MTRPEEPNDAAVEEPHATVGAFVDGEVVDPAALKAALAVAAGRDYLVDLLQLREAVGAMGPATWSAARRRPRLADRLVWAAAAAAVVMGVTGGYLAGQRAVPATTSTVDAVIEVEAAPAAPPPTRTITLRPGVNWTDSPGGQ
jgi:hypothetical protein